MGEQVLILSVGGELDTAFVLPGIYSGDNPAPSASADALHIRFPDGAVIEYEPETSALTVSGIKTASVTASDSVTATVPVVTVKASTRVTLDTPEVVCTNKLTTGTLEVQKGGTMRGNIEHTGGELSSNGKVLQAKWDKLQRGVAEFSISLATGRADIYTETPVKVSGFKRVIDEQDWTITKVTHFLNNSGFTTSLELEVRLSDVEYETEDDE